MRLGYRAIATLPLLALAISGCGGGDKGPATSTPAATAAATPRLGKEELLAQGDAICAEVNAAVGTIASSTSGSVSQATQVAELYSGMVDRLKGLGAPEEAAGYSEFVAAAEALAQAEADVELAAERGEEGALEAAEADASTALASFQSAAQAYGFERCGEAPSAPATGSPPNQSGEESAAAAAEAAPQTEPTPETGGAGTAEGGGAAAGGGTSGGSEGSGGAGSGGIGPG